MAELAKQLQDAKKKAELLDALDESRDPRWSLFAGALGYIPAPEAVAILAGMLVDALAATHPRLHEIRESGDPRCGILCNAMRWEG